MRDITPHPETLVRTLEAPPATSPHPALFRVFPTSRGRIPWVGLADLPTPVASIASLAGRDAWVKRDDVTSPIYGGNKVRTLEVLFGDAISRGATHIYSTGAFGSNHALATVLHAPRVDLAPGVVLFPQPESPSAHDNLAIILARRAEARFLRHWSSLPLGMSAAERHHARRGERAYVMVPGGATPLGALGYASAALELAQQVARGELPRPATIVVGVGSTCTAAGLLLGLHLAARIGLGFRDDAGRPAPPVLVAARVTPWPVTSAYRIVSLAVRASRLLAERVGDRAAQLDAAALRPHLRVDGRFLGRGYGYATRDGHAAIAAFRERAHLDLDSTYSAKSGAAFLACAKTDAPGPLLFWSTKSTVPLPEIDLASASLRAPGHVQRWLERAARR